MSCHTDMAKLSIMKQLQWSAVFQNSRAGKSYCSKQLVTLDYTRWTLVPGGATGGKEEAGVDFAPIGSCRDSYLTGDCQK